MTTKTFPIFDSMKLHIPWNCGSDTIEKSGDISWDESVTDITSAKLSASIRSNIGRVGMYIRLNSTDILHLRWAWDESDKVMTAEDEVLTQLRNGSNLFTCEGYKDVLVVADLDFIVTINVVLTYTGTEPKVKPPYEKYIVPAIAGVMGILFIVTAVRK